MLGFCFLILKILCITVLSILCLLLILLLLVLFAPVKYKSEGSRHADELHVKALFTYLNPIIRVKVIYSDKAIVQVKIWGITISPVKSKKTKDKQRENKSGKEGSVNNAETKAVPPATEHSETNNQKKDDAKGSKKDAVLHYASLYAENKELILDVCHIFFKAIKTMLPGECNVHATFGTGQADTTGYIYALYCSLQHVLPGEVSLEPVWTEAQLEGEYDLKGKIRGIHLLIAIVKIFGNKQVRVLIKKLRRV